MKVELNRPPIESLTLTLSLAEAQCLFEILNWPTAVSQAVKERSSSGRDVFAGIESMYGALAPYRKELL